ncbi:replication initiation protein [Bacillus thuringiensis]|uniref:replication initiation protein n=1 Tax=Bacillus thuringiensis TaxID=1428 RepID=UPI000BFD54D3|nr:replication initiation protein [Bacillus thuringiensis]PGT90080.1 initiator RepB protein [Bacillus thuringiensis]
MSTKQDLQMTDNNIVSKSNTLIEANSRLNLVEQKMLLCLASNIEPSDRDFKTYTFPVKQFYDLLGLSGTAKYTELSKITKELVSKVIEIRLGEELIQVSWLSSSIYNRKKGTIDMRFDPLLKPFLLELSSKFTSYKLSNVVKLGSTYSIRIYELLKQYEDLRERTISMETLRYYLDAIDIYPNYANFKQRVLKPAQKELKQKTDISFEFEEIKQGRKVHKIRFIIRGQKRQDAEFNQFEERLGQFQHLNAFEQKIKRFEERCKQKVFPKVLEKWKEHEDFVLETIEDIRFRIDIDNPIGYVEFVLASRIKEMEEKEQLGAGAQTGEEEQDNIVGKTNTIIGEVIQKYSKTTGAIATFLVKDTATTWLTEIVTVEEAEAIWKENEAYVMDKIYEGIKKSRTKRKY